MYLAINLDMYSALTLVACTAIICVTIYKLKK